MVCAIKIKLMSVLLFILLGLGNLANSAPWQDKRPGNGETAKLLEGRWQLEEKRLNFKVDISLRPDGTFTKLTEFGGGKYESSGTWKVSKELLEFKYGKSTNPEWQGRVTHERIASVDITEFRVRDGKDGFYTYKRVKE